MKFSRIAAAFLTLSLGLCLCLPAAFAAAEIKQEAVLPGLKVSIQSTGETPLPKETLTVKLEAVTENAPMPETAVLHITDGESAEFGPITYRTPGVYKYTVTQQAGTNTRGVYDDTTYYVVVNALWIDNSDFKATVYVHAQEDLSDAKTDEVVFKNHYKSVNPPYEPNPYNPEPGPTPTTPENPAPEDARPTPSTPEPTTPDAVVADARPEGPKLIQTGQLNWPVPVLTGSGLALVAVGGWLLRRSRKRDENA